MRNLKLILTFWLFIAYWLFAIVVCFIISSAITLYAFGNTFSTPQLQVHFTWWSVVMMFGLTIGLLFLWTIVERKIVKEIAAKRKISFV